MPKIIKTELGLTELLQKQNGAVFMTHMVDLLSMHGFALPLSVCADYVITPSLQDVDCMHHMCCKFFPVSCTKLKLIHACQSSYSD